MNRKIKLIWDFRGPTASKTAEHHEIHLKEYIKFKDLGPSITGHQQIDEMYSFAYMVVEEKNMIMIRDVLKPHRAELYQE